MLKVAIMGAAGRMGHALIRCANRIDKLTVTAALESSGHPDLGKDAGIVAGETELGVKITDEMDTINNADVSIDFALHDAIPAHAAHAADHGIPLVVGSTGLSGEETKALESASGSIPVVWAPNMSMGINLLLSLVSKTAESLQKEYEIELFETHHIHKKDAPSGTALKLGEYAAKARNLDPEKDILHEQQPARGQILIHSTREGEVVGDHSVVFKSQWEEITLSHHAISRDTFAMGALQAAQWVAYKDPGMYNMQDVLGL
ncbi:MAG: 4-hydroxy-tetrahydrodipicolinate reductase [Verrucomicrobiota bacterium]